MKRKLGKIETAAALSGEHAIWNIVGILKLDKVPPQETLRRALDTLQNRQPFLNSRMMVAGRKHYFVTENVPSIPLRVIERKNPGHWIQIAENDLNYKFDHLTGPLLKCSVVKNGTDQGELILCAQHSIVDGTAIEALFHDLLTLCAEIETGNEVETIALEPLPPVETRFPIEFQGLQRALKSASYFSAQMQDELRYNMAIRSHRQPPIHLKVNGKIIQFKTPANETADLIGRTRQERVTLNSLINAAVLLSVRKILYSRADRPYRFMSMADLRPYVDPPPASNQVGCYLAPLRYTIPVTAEDDLWSLTHKMNTQIYSSTKRGEKYLASVMTEGVIRMTFGMKKFRMATTAISYGGTTSIAASYGPYKVTGVHGFVSNFGLGPEFSGRVGLYNDELIWDMLYLDTDMGAETAAEIVAEIQSLLI